jgi:ketosteroid isomerase-like protein
MSQENVEIIRKAVAAWNRADWDAVLACVHPDSETIDDPRVPGAQTLRGRSEIEKYIKSLTRYWESVRFVPERFVDYGDDVFVFTRMIARTRRGGPEIERPLDEMFTLLDGKVIRSRVFSSREQALEAAGLRE